ncbi:SELS protein, partial [Chloroceryle aenea]|nr:SELS protein [Chloroceryle aenea]
VAIYLLIQKLSQSLAGRPSSRARAADAAVEPEAVVRRQEALAAARLRMQEQLNAQAERYKEKQKQLEEEKRRQKIAMWESMQEGKSYKGNLKLNQQEVESGASTSSAVPKSKPNKKPLRGGGYNPLSGEGGGTCSWRPGRRGPSAGG